ncbi:retrovirus-related pol polyprotein from transposon TNT 1-94 [Tanacetum coccineum]
MANDPLYLASSDHPGMMLTNTPFYGGNFLGWSRTIKMALWAKLKLGFIDGSSPKPAVIDNNYQSQPLIYGKNWMKGMDKMDYETKPKLDMDQKLVNAVCQEMMKMFKGKEVDCSSNMVTLLSHMQDPSTRQILAAGEGFNNLYICKPSS